MEDWQLEFEWLRVRHYVKGVLKKSELPDLNGILFLIGIQELNQIKPGFSKEEKQDLMHVAVCRLLSEDGYYRFEGLDQDGWPHFEPVKPFTTQGVKEQEQILKEKVVQYFLPYLALLEGKNEPGHE